MTFIVDIETPGGLRRGAGPLTTAAAVKVVRQLDRAGAITLTTPATDPATALLRDTTRPRLRAWHVVGGVRTEFASGTLASHEIDVGDRGISFTGYDALIELADRTVGKLLLTDGGTGPKLAVNVLSAIIAFAPAGWSVTGTPSAPVYLQFANESVLAALGKIAERTGDHFRLGTGRQVVWLPKTTPAASSGIRAIQGGDPVALEGNPGVCLIAALRYVRDASEMLTRILPYGAGNAEARVTLAGTTRIAPAGYDLDTAANYIRHIASEAGGLRIESAQDFNDIVALGAAAAHDTSAADALFDAALAALKKRQSPLDSYDVSIVKHDAPLLPGQTIRVQYRGYAQQDGGALFAWVDVDADLLILSTTEEITALGGRGTTALQVATIDRWPTTDTEVIVKALRNVQMREGHHQPAQSAQVADIAQGVTQTAFSTIAIGGGQSITRHLSAAATLDPPAIAAGATAELSVAVPGLVAGDSCVATPAPGIEAGLLWAVYASAANTATLRIANVSGSAISPASRAWRVDAWGH